jgi:hypothetical protein
LIERSLQKKPSVILDVGGGAGAAFERLSAKLADGGVKAAAFSVDDESTTGALVDKHRIHYPVGFGADADAVAAATGAYVNAEPRYLQSTGFVLAPDGKIVTAVYTRPARSGVSFRKTSRVWSPTSSRRRIRLIGRASLRPSG